MATFHEVLVSPVAVLSPRTRLAGVPSTGEEIVEVARGSRLIDEEDESV
jgi:hypothetical protein